MTIRVPGFLLRERPTIEDWQGDTSVGQSYAAPRTVKAAMQATDRLVHDRDGKEAAASLIMIVRPEAGATPLESRITWRGKVYRVLTEAAVPDERRPVHREMMLGRLGA